MRKVIIITTVFLLAIVVLITILSFSNSYYFFKSITSEKSKYPSTYFIEPSSLFVACYTKDDCMKVKGTACPPSKGGAETCINKNYMQEYLSNIEILSGKEWEVNCPNIDSSTNKICLCINNVCKLVSE